MITPQIIYASTNGGLDIITKYFPEAEEGVNKRSHKFRIVPEHEDPNPSCVLYSYNGIWRVKSFQTGELLSPLDIVMRQEAVDFADAIKIVARDFNLSSESEKTPKIEAVYRKREVTKEPDDYFEYAEKDFEVWECQKIFAPNIWQYLCKYDTGGKSVPPEGDERGLYNAKRVFDKYNFKLLDWYEFLSRDKKDKNKKVIHRFESTTTYPIFLFEEGSWQKIYKPAEPKSEYRFVSFGKKPQKYTFGMENLEFEYEEAVMHAMANQKPKDPEDETPEVKPNTKVPEVIICTGGSDALNIAALGYPVIWFNSESVKKEDIPFFRLQGYAYKVFYVGDLDHTGREEAIKLGLEYLDLHLIDLPETLNRYRDDKNGKPCKDVKDYFSHYRKKDFEALLSKAYPLKFWEEKYKFDRKGMPVLQLGEHVKEYKPDAELVYNFLKKHGFWQMKISSRKEPILIRIQDNTVSEIEPEDCRKFIKEFIRSRNFERRLINTFHRSPDLNDTSLRSLENVELDFEDCGKEFQWMFFQNKHWKIYKDRIEEYTPKKSGMYVWSDEIIKHDVKLTQAPFRIFMNADGEADIEILDDSCLFLKYLINTSRVHWRTELEERLDLKPKDEQAAYRIKHKFDIAGPLLNDDEIKEQKTHLINKITSLGYLLHRYKEYARSYCVWAMDAMQVTGQSYGGTGKSIAYYLCLKQLMKHLYVEGRNENVTSNQFLFGPVNEYTDLVYIDDGHEYLNFNRFFSIVTGSMEATKKGMDARIIEFKKSPKLCITSNYPPRGTDSATQRRMWYTSFADYYHKNPNKEYREERDPKSEFGKNLFDDFTKEEKNAWLNTMAACIQAWLSVGKIDPPLEGVMQNTYKAKMGPTFLAWADVFFEGTEDDTNLNKEIQKGYAFKHFQFETGDTKTQINTWLEKLNVWCMYKGYILNPKDLHNTKDHRIIRKQVKIEYKHGLTIEDTNAPKTSVEMIFVRSTQAFNPVTTVTEEQEEEETFTTPVKGDLPF